jgi:cytochrome c biogenesis protein
VGTAIPQGLPAEEYRRLFPGRWQTLLALGLDRYYTGWIFRGLLAGLALNLAACAFGRSADGWRHFRGRGKASLRLPLADRQVWAERLRGAGFRLAAETPLLASRRSWAFLGFPLVHLAPFLVMAGALWGSLGGYVGTRNVYVGSSTQSADRWPSGEASLLPFTVSVRDFRLRYHPIALRIEALVPQRTPLLLETREGGSVEVPGTPYRIFVQAFDPTTGDLVYFVEGSNLGSRLGPFSRGQEQGAPVRVRPEAFRELKVRRAETVVALTGAQEEPLVEQIVAVNEPLSYHGLRIYLTAWGEDQDKNRYVGLQITRDPGQVLVWAGGIALSLGLFLLLFGDGAWAREEGQELWLRGSRGRGSLRRLLENSMPGEEGQAERERS